jgi:hypothetical protein
LEFVGLEKERLKPGAKIALSLTVFVLKLGINPSKDRVRAEGEMIRDQNLLRISSGDEL